jgi:hypothetical protein
MRRLERILLGADCDALRPRALAVAAISGTKDDDILDHKFYDLFISNLYPLLPTPTSGLDLSLSKPSASR